MLTIYGLFSYEHLWVGLRWVGEMLCERGGEVWLKARRSGRILYGLSPGGPQGPG